MIHDTTELYLFFFFQEDIILGLVKKEDLGLWEDKLIEGKSYIMNNFKILINQGQCVFDHPFKLLFTGEITIKEQLLHAIPMRIFKFKSIRI